MMNYTYGRLKTEGIETPLSQINPFMTRVQFSYTDKKFSSDFFVNYNGWKRIADYYVSPGGEDNQVYATPSGMPAWFTLNLRGSCKVNKNITLQAGIDNILDTQYRTFASGINAPGRNIFIAFRCNL
jgi:hemoglobin/transferrin/lactoferrin receptor protein